jgi:hypothetical protein
MIHRDADGIFTWCEFSIERDANAVGLLLAQELNLFQQHLKAVMSCLKRTYVRLKKHDATRAAAVA